MVHKNDSVSQNAKSAPMLTILAVDGNLQIHYVSKKLHP